VLGYFCRFDCIERLGKPCEQIPVAVMRVHPGTLPSPRSSFRKDAEPATGVDVGRLPVIASRQSGWVASWLAGWLAAGLACTAQHYLGLTLDLAESVSAGSCSTKCWLREDDFDEVKQVRHLNQQSNPFGESVVELKRPHTNTMYSLHASLKARILLQTTLQALVHWYYNLTRVLSAHNQHL
jgi:hypothetical protein